MNRIQKSIFERMDGAIAVSVGLCLLLAGLIPRAQAITACITALLCTQGGAKPSWKSGLTRLIVTAVGGLVGVLVVLADEWIGNRWLLIALVMVGVMVTLAGCRLAKVPDFSTRIGCITLILVVLTLPGPQRITYAVARLLSTLGGVAVVVVVSALFAGITGEGRRGKPEKQTERT